MIDPEKNLLVPEVQDLTKRAAPVKREVRKYLHKDEFLERFNAIPTEKGRDRMFIFTLWTTGLRVSEAIRLRKDNLDFTTSMMRVTWLKNRKYLERVIPIPSELRMLLAVYCGKLEYDTKLFHFSRQAAFACVKKHLGVSPHIIRHSYAKHALDSGMNLVELQRLLGHARLTTTQVYLQISPQDLQESVKKMRFLE